MLVKVHTYHRLEGRPGRPRADVCSQTHSAESNQCANPGVHYTSDDVDPNQLLTAHEMSYDATESEK
jgi:hypothetical protein